MSAPWGNSPGSPVIIFTRSYDTPLAALSNKSRMLYDYFKQLFAQVTNPPIDPIREEIVMSLTSFIGPRPNLLGLEATDPPLRLEISQPLLTKEGMAKLRNISKLTKGRFRSLVLDITYPASQGAKGCEAALEALCKAAEPLGNSTSQGWS